MPKIRASQLQQENEELQSTIDDTYEELTNALDPALTREELVQKVQEVVDALAPEDEDQETGNGDESGE
jgi:hypothetical protein